MTDATHTALRQLARDVDDAYNAADPARMASCWTCGGLNISPFGDRYEGRDAIEAELREGLEGFMRGSRHTLAIAQITGVDEETIVADGVATISGITGFDGTTMEPLSSDFSMICTRAQDGAWRIAQMRAYRFIARPGAAG